MENLENSVAAGEMVSVVVPVRDRAGIVCRTLESIENQTYRPIHLIVVDNGSRDETLRVVSDWKYAHEAEGFKITILLESTPGACLARNRGLREVDTDKVVFFDSDDIMMPSLITKAMAAFDSNPEAKIAYWRGLRRDLLGGERLSHFTTKNLLECQMVHSMLTTTYYMSRTDYFRSVGGWDETLPVWNDWELGVRLLLPNPSSASIDEVLTLARSNKDSITGETFTQKQGEWERSIRRVMEDIEASGRPDKNRLLRIALYRQVILAAHYRRENNRSAAETLLRTALSSPLLNPAQRATLRAAYAYTRRGGRGAFRILSPLL